MHVDENMITHILKCTKKEKSYGLYFRIRKFVIKCKSILYGKEVKCHYSDV